MPSSTEVLRNDSGGQFLLDRVAGSTGSPSPPRLRASELIREFSEKRWQIVITVFIFAETPTYFVRSQLLRETILTDLLDKPRSYCDALSSAVIERLKLPYAKSFDHHFAQPGSFEVIR